MVEQSTSRRISRRSAARIVAGGWLRAVMRLGVGTCVWVGMWASPGTLARPAIAVEPPSVTSSALQDNRSAPAVEAAQIQEWIRDLDSEHFIKRETATQQLQAAGAAAIEPLREALRQNRPELATRGIHILRQLIFDGNESDQEAAVAALEKLSAQGTSVNARRAASALETADEFLAQRSIEELVQRGARVEYSAFPVGFQFQQKAFSLELGDPWHGEDRDLRRLARLKSVTFVTLSGRQVTDEWLRYVSTMPGLARLRISRGNISAAGLGHLRDSRRLNELVLTRISVDDSAVEPLSGLTAATEVQLFATDVTKEGETRLQAALPNAKIVRREVFLGITSPRGNNWSITAVEPDTPASRGGLEIGDVITRFNEHEIVDFDNLSVHIAASKRGDVVNMEIRRGNETLIKRIRFD